MDNETEVIRRQMEETRTALQGKLETLEQQVKDTVQETTEAVTGTVEAVKETVETVKDTVQATVDTVKDTVEETVQSVRDTLDLPRMVNAHPWPMFAGAAAVGFVGGRLLGSFPRPSAAAMPVPTNYGGIKAGGNAFQPPAPPRRSWWSFLTDHYSEELDKLKGLAIATVGNVVREMLTENVPPQIATQTREMIDGIVTKLGAQPIPEPLFHLGNGHEEQTYNPGASHGKPQEAGRF